MSLHPSLIEPVPEQTAQIAHAAFPKGSLYLTLRDELGTLYRDDDFSTLFSASGQPAFPPWRLALVTLLQFRENLSDRQAAEAVRARIDWKYLLGLELADPGFDFSVLCEFRARLIAGEAVMQLLDGLLGQCRELGLLKARGRQRTDSTHVLTSVRVLSRLELVGETLRAALNEIASIEPEWLRSVTPKDWYKRYSRRVEDRRLPRTAPEQQNYAQTVGEDGFALLDWVESAEAPAKLRQLQQVAILRTAWNRHYIRDESPADGSPSVRFKTNQEVSQAEEKVESPYDPEARYRSKSGMHWTGYMVHISETCDENSVHLITHVHTTPADVHEAMCTESIHQALTDKGVPPLEHLVDAGYVSAELLLRSRVHYGIDLVGPARINPTWQTKVEGAYTGEQFTIDWEKREARCPQDVVSKAWRDYNDAEGKPYHLVHFPKAACQGCQARALCTQAKQQPRRLYLHPRPEHEALHAARQRLKSEAGKRLYAQRAGVEGSLSQGVRAFGIRHTRYRRLAKTHLQQVVTAVAINLDRIAAWLAGRPLAATRISHFAALVVA
ncbi:MAG TPA: IS1182 family transposase [Methylobacter sp.]|jgi:transposase